MLHLIGRLGADGCGYKSVEFYGDALPAMSISERMTMANLAMEMGSKCVFVPPDEKTREWLLPRLKDPATLPARLRRCGCASTSRSIARRSVGARAHGGVSRTRWRTPSRSPRWWARASTRRFSARAPTASTRTSRSPRSILQGRKIDPRVRLIVTPGSKEIMLEAMRSRRARDADGERRAGDESGLRRLRGRRRHDGGRRSVVVHGEPQLHRPHGQQQERASICPARRRWRPRR